MKEIRVYAVSMQHENIDNHDVDFHSCTDSVFMDIAKEQGNVLSLNEFARQSNNDMLDFSIADSFIRFIEVENQIVCPKCGSKHVLTIDNEPLCSEMLDTEIYASGFCGECKETFNLVGDIIWR